jgi:hypothetical protein
MSVDVSDEHVASIFMIEEGNEETFMKQVAMQLLILRP